MLHACHRTKSNSMPCQVRLQNGANNGLYANSFDCLQSIVRSEGAAALFTGLPATIFRNSVWNGVYFGSMFKIRQHLGSSEGLSGKLRTMVGGFAGGMLATCFNAPLDVAKSRIQGDT